MLIDKLLALKHCDFLFLDEAHPLTPLEQELLYEAIDHRRVPAPDPDGKPRGAAGLAAQGGVKTQGTTAQGAAPQDKPRYLRIQPFTLVLATDRPGALRNALKKWFPLRLNLPPYELDELREIVSTIAARLEVLPSPKATGVLARACLGLPRRAEHLLGLLRHFHPAGREQLKTVEIREFLRAHLIDPDGPGEVERYYLTVLQERGRASLDTLALQLGTDRDEVQFQVEPVLVRLGLVDVKSSGRLLTEKGRQRITGRRANP